MNKITSLSKAQTDKYPEYIKKWTDIGLCTDPADRPAAEAAINKMYIIGGLTPPKMILWSLSPYAMGNLFYEMTTEEKNWNNADRKNSIKNFFSNISYGAHDANWLGFYDFFRNECGLIEETKKLEGLWELSKSCGWILPYENVCFASERHNIVKQYKTPSGQYRLHCEDGKAIDYPDGKGLYFIHGIRVNKQIVLHPETLTIKQINSELNSEIKRVMIERYGYEKYLRNSNAVLIDSCPDNHPLKGMQTAKLWQVSDLVLLDLLNSTPEPDGTIKRYIIPINPSHYNGDAGKFCIAASASTWRHRNDINKLVFSNYKDYSPQFES
jgi:hypothetical protein